jgi:dethiobiotin synthetase
MHGLFITSVGTGIGKTLVTAILCHQSRSRGQRTSALKPVVSGYLPDDPASDPALILRSLGVAPVPEAIAAISPWRFALPASPHRAARNEGGGPSLERVIAFCKQHERATADLLLVEGAGGVMSPLGETYTCLDLIEGLGYAVILVTGSYLGAISHTLTALAAIRGRNVPIRGIVVSESVPSAGLAETVESVQQFGGPDLLVCSLPRLSVKGDATYPSAPPLLGLLDLERT